MIRIENGKKFYSKQKLLPPNVPGVLFDLDVFGLGLVPLLLLSWCCLSGDELSRSLFGLDPLVTRPEVVGLDDDDDDDSLTLGDMSFF